MCYIQYCFFPLGGGVDDVVGEVVINQTSYEGYQFDVHCIQCQTSTDILEKGTFICGPLPFKWMDVFQYWLDCFSSRVLAFIQNINFLSSVVFVYW